jgi:hypothetical protein
VWPLVHSKTMVLVRVLVMSGCLRCVKRVAVYIAHKRYIEDCIYTQTGVPVSTGIDTFICIHRLLYTPIVISSKKPLIQETMDENSISDYHSIKHSSENRKNMQQCHRTKCKDVHATLECMRCEHTMCALSLEVCDKCCDVLCAGCMGANCDLCYVCDIVDDADETGEDTGDVVDIKRKMATISIGDFVAGEFQETGD